MGRNSSLFLLSALAVASMAGCRNCCCLDHYGCAIDHIKDYPVIFDTWYCPRLDISRAGKPDWCGPVNRLVGCRRCNCVDEWTRYDEIWLFPPRHPYLFPGASFPGPSQYADDSQILEPYAPSPSRSPLETIPPAPLPEPPSD